MAPARPRLASQCLLRPRGSHPRKCLRKHASPNHSRASLKLIVEPGLYMLLRFQKAAVRENYEPGNQAFSKRLRFLTTRDASRIFRQASIPSRVPISTACPRIRLSQPSSNGNTSNCSSSRLLTKEQDPTRRSKQQSKPTKRNSVQRVRRATPSHSFVLSFSATC